MPCPDSGRLLPRLAPSWPLIHSPGVSLRLPVCTCGPALEHAHHPAVHHQGEWGASLMGFRDFRWSGRGVMGLKEMGPLFRVYGISQASRVLAQI